jgi:amidase
LANLHKSAVHDTYRPTFARHNLSALIVLSDFAGMIAAAFGGPVISVPLGFLADNISVPQNESRPHNRYPGQPFGLSFIGREWEEAELLGHAYAFEHHTRVRDQRKPYDAAMPRSGIIA